MHIIMRQGNDLHDNALRLSYAQALDSARRHRGKDQALFCVMRCFEDIPFYNLTGF
jgi:hypothetical protein